MQEGKGGVFQSWTCCLVSQQEAGLRKIVQNACDKQEPGNKIIMLAILMKIMNPREPNMGQPIF